MYGYAFSDQVDSQLFQVGQLLQASVVGNFVDFVIGELSVDTKQKST